MSQVFNLSNFLNTREAAAFVGPEPETVPDISFPELVKEILGVDVSEIDVATVEALHDHFVNTLFSSPSAVYPAAAGGHKSTALSFDPTRKVLMLKRLFSRLEQDGVVGDALLKFKEKFGNDPDSLDKLFQEVMKRFNLSYDSRLVDVFKERLTKKRIEALANLVREREKSGQDLRDVELGAELMKQDLAIAYGNLRDDFIDECRDFGLNDQQINWIMSHSEGADASSMGEAFWGDIDKSTISDLLRRKNILTTRLSQLTNDDMTSVILSGKKDLMIKKGVSPENADIFVKLSQVPSIAAISIEESYRSDRNLSDLEVPPEPHDLFAKDFIEDSDVPREVQLRMHPRNLQLIKRLLEIGGYTINGKALKELPSYLNLSSLKFETRTPEWEQAQQLIGQGKDILDESVEFPGGSYVDRALFYAARSLCGTETNFREMVMASGAITEDGIDGQVTVGPEDDKSIKKRGNKTQMQVLFGKAPRIDPRFGDFGFFHDSDKEGDAIETLRNSFGLEVVPSSMGIPTLDDCKINAQGFQIDFLVIAPVLKNWIKDPQFDVYHPIISEQVNFVGEYYGFNSDFKRSLRLFESDGSLASIVKCQDTGEVHEVDRVKHLEGLMNPDGEIAKIPLRPTPYSGDKQEYDATYGTPIDGGTAYRIREEWKKVTEDFAAAVTGVASIHIPRNFNDKDVANELIKCGIIFKYNGKTWENSPMTFIDNHINECQYPECDSKKVSETGTAIYERKYNVQEAMVLSKIAEFKLAQGLTPKLREEKEKLAKAKDNYQKQLAQQMNVDVSQLWSKISYPEFLKQFHASTTVEESGFGRQQVWQYYSEKMELVAQLQKLLSSPEHSFAEEIRLRQAISDLHAKHLKYFQDIYDSHTTSEDPSNTYVTTLKQLEDLRAQVAMDDKKFTNQELKEILKRLVVSYVPQNKQKRSSVASKTFDLFKIAISSN